MKQSLWITALVLAAIGAPPVAWGSATVLEFNSNKGNSIPIGPPNSFTYGWSFTTNTAITVDALDAYLPGNGGDLVQLYDESGNVLASTTLSTSDAQEGSPTLFYTQAITPVTLQANTTYYIAESMNGSAYPESVTYYSVTALTVDPSITYDGAVSYAAMGASGLVQHPTTDTVWGGVLNSAFFGPDFDIVTPEPSSMLLFGTGLLGVGFVMRKRLFA